MVKLTILDGPDAGQVLEIEGSRRDPSVVLMELATLGCRWRLDLRPATDRERREWNQADAVGLVLWAVVLHRTIRIQGTLRAPGPQDLEDVISWVETLRASGVLDNAYVVANDDENGLVVGRRAQPDGDPPSEAADAGD